MVKKVGDAPRVGFPLAHIVGDELEGVGGFPGDLLGVAAGVQAFRLVEHGAQPGPFLGTGGDITMAEAVDALFGIGEVGMDFPMVDVSDDQQGRIFQVFAVTLQLLVGGAEVFVFVGRFVFDGEVVFVVDIGESVAVGGFDRRLKYELFAGLGRAVAAGHLDADQVADIAKMRLRALFFAERGVCPFVDKFLWRHRDVRKIALQRGILPRAPRRAYHPQIAA